MEHDPIQLIALTVIIVWMVVMAWVVVAWVRHSNRKQIRDWERGKNGKSNR